MTTPKRDIYVLATHFHAAAAFAAKTFREYEAIHRAKGDTEADFRKRIEHREKAEKNAEHALRFEILLREGEWR